MKIRVLLLFVLLAVVSATFAQVEYKIVEPISDWVDMSDSTILMNSCMNCSFYYDFPEGFEFYGNSINSIYFTTNGFIEVDRYLDANTYFGVDFPVTAPYYECISYGGNTDGRTVGSTYSKLTGEKPNRIITFQTRYSTGSNGTDYQADIQISFIEKFSGIQFLYKNVSGSTGPSEYLGLNQGDGIRYTLIDDTTGHFPMVDTGYLFIPDIEKEAGIFELSSMRSCELSENEVVTVGVFNAGSDTIKSLPIFLVSGLDTIAKDTIKEEIRQLDSYIHTFSQTMDFSEDGVYGYSASFEYPDLLNNNSISAYSSNYITPVVGQFDACFGEPASLMASGGDFYRWYNSNYLEYILYEGEDEFITSNLYETTLFSVEAYNKDLYLDDMSSSDIYVDHDNASGDDRAGIAVTPDYLYIVGDDYTVRMDAYNLSGQVSLPIRDGIFSDLSTGKLYEIYSTIHKEPLESWGTPYSINAIVEMDEDLNYGDTIMLSDTFNFDDDNWECGIYPGAGMVLVKDGVYGNLYQINIEDATVDSLGVYEDLEGDWYTENYAQWGFTETRRGVPVSIIFPYGDNEIRRIDLISKDVSLVGIIDRLGDLHSITASPWHNRLFYHSETNDEDGGYVKAVLFSGGECIAETEVSITPQAWAGEDSEGEVCSDNSAAALISLVEGNPQTGGIWNDVSGTGALTDGVLDATNLSAATYEFEYTVEAQGACTIDASASVSLEVVVAANAGVGGAITVSKENSYYNLFNVLDGTQDATGYWIDEDNTGALSGSLIDLSKVSVGNYTFSYLAFGFGPCGDDIEEISVTFVESSSIKELDEGLICVYPNPVKQILTINSEELSNRAIVELSDLQGKVVHKEILTMNHIDVSLLSKGIYILKIMDNNKIFVTNIVVE